MLFTCLLFEYSHMVQVSIEARSIQPIAHHVLFAYGKPMVLVFQSFFNERWERKLRDELQVELSQKGVAVYSSLSGASRALARFYEYHRFQRELAAENQ